MVYPCCVYIIPVIIVFLVNTALFLKVKHRYVYQLAKVAIIGLNTKK